MSNDDLDSINMFSSNVNIDSLSSSIDKKTKKSKSKSKETDNVISISPTYVKFFELVEQFKNDKIDYSESELKNWTPKFILAYICMKFYNKFGVDFVLSLDEPISKSFEYKCSSKLFTYLNANCTQSALVKEYIDWYFESYSGKRAFRSINALAKSEKILEFKQNTLNKKVATKSFNKNNTIENKNVLDILQTECGGRFNYVSTYGDLLFLKDFCNQNASSSSSSSSSSSNSEHLEISEMLKNIKQFIDF